MKGYSMRVIRMMVALILGLVGFSAYAGDIDKLAWVQVKDKRLLVARSKGQEAFYIPGGKREQGECDEEALIREIKEELSVDLKPETIEHCQTFRAQAHGKPEGVMVKITCYLADFTGEIKAESEIEEVRWVSYEEKEKCSTVTQLIMEWLKSADLL